MNEQKNQMKADLSFLVAFEIHLFRGYRRIFSHQSIRLLHDATYQLESSYPPPRERNHRIVLRLD